MADSHAVFGSAPNCYRQFAFNPRSRKMFTQRRRERRDTAHHRPRAARRVGDGEWRARHADSAQRAAERGQPHGAGPFAVKHYRSPELVAGRLSAVAPPRQPPFDKLRASVIVQPSHQVLN